MDTINGLISDGRETALIAFTLFFLIVAIAWLRGAMNADKKVWKGIFAGLAIYIVVAGVISGAWMNLANRITGDVAALGHVAAPAVPGEQA